MPAADGQEVAKAEAEASSIVKHGLVEAKCYDVRPEEVAVLTVLMLARSAELDEALQVVYNMFDVLDDANCLPQLPSEAELVAREGELQRLLTLLNEVPSVKSQRHALAALARGLLRHAPSRELSFKHQLAPLQLWRAQYTRQNPQPGRKRKPPPPEPQNVWFFLAPERSPMMVPRNELSKMFKKWMLQNHPDKGGDEVVAARVSAAYSQAMAKGLTADGANPDANERVDEDAVYRQQQQLAEPEWSAYRRAVSERSYCLSATYLEQRLLKAARWHLARRGRGVAFQHEVAALDAGAFAGVPGLATGGSGGSGGSGGGVHGGSSGADDGVLKESARNSARDSARDAARTDSPRSKPAMAFGKRTDAHETRQSPHKNARDSDVSNNKGFFSNVAGSLHPASPKGRGGGGGGGGGPRGGGAEESLRPMQMASGILFDHCTAEGEGLAHAYPKQPIRFTLRARDRLFRPVACSPEPFHVVVRGKQIVTPTMQPNADGSIAVEFVIAVCGTYKVHVRGGTKGTHILGSPFTLSVKAAPPSGGQSLAEGSGLRCARAGEPTSFVLHRKDSTGRPIPKGTSRFVVAFAYGEEARTADKGAKGLADGCFTWKVRSRAARALPPRARVEGALGASVRPRPASLRASAPSAVRAHAPCPPPPRPALTLTSVRASPPARVRVAAGGQGRRELRRQLHHAARGRLSHARHSGARLARRNRGVAVCAHRRGRRHLTGPL